MAATSASLGKSNMRGRATGLVTPLLDMSERTQCLVYGPGLLKEETHFISQNRLQQFINKCIDLGQTVIYPKSALAAEIKRIGAITPDGRIIRPEPIPGEPVEPTAPCYMLKSGARPLICLQTGQFYVSADQAGRKHNLTGQAISYQMKTGGKTLKGFQFRLATPDEIRSALWIPGWKAQVADIDAII